MGRRRTACRHPPRARPLARPRRPAPRPERWHDRAVAPIDFEQFDVLTFDCYGTLIDWESGILSALHAALDPAASDGKVGLPSDEALLEAFGRHEAAIEAGPYQPYRSVLQGALRGIAADVGVEPGDDAVATFGGSVVDWPAFPDSPAALARLAARFRLGVITNCDDDLFA